jgi:hypothetical protein
VTPGLFANLFLAAVYIAVAGLAVAWWVDATTGEIAFGGAMAAAGLALWAAARA